MIKVNSATAAQPVSEWTLASGSGQIEMFAPVRIAWPGLVRADVARRLNMMQSMLSGTAPIPPPKPPNLGGRR